MRTLIKPKHTSNNPHSDPIINLIRFQLSFQKAWSMARPYSSVRILPRYVACVTQSKPSRKQYTELRIVATSNPIPVKLTYANLKIIEWTYKFAHKSLFNLLTVQKLILFSIICFHAKNAITCSHNMRIIVNAINLLVTPVEIRIEAM